MSGLRSLLEALPKSPGMRIIHFCKEPILIDEVQNYCQDQADYCEYLLATFSQEDLEGLVGYENSYTQVKYLNENRPRYHMQSKQYDYLFVTTMPEKRVEFFQKVYSALKNAAPLFIIIKNCETTFTYLIESELIESNYVATNKTELGEYTIISAKKMHGWSGS